MARTADEATAAPGARIVSAADAARITGLSDKTIRAWIAAERLPAKKVHTPGAGPATWRISLEELAKVEGVAIDRVRLAELEARRSAPRSGRTSATLSSSSLTSLVARVEQLEREVRQLRALLTLREGRHTALPPADASSRPPVNDSEQNLAAISTDADYHRPPAFPLSANPVQHRPGRRAPARTTGVEPPLPEGWRAAIEYVQSFGVPQTTARRWVEGLDKHSRPAPAEQRKLPKPHEGIWASGPPGTFPITTAYDEEQQRLVAELVPRLLGQRSPRTLAGVLATSSAGVDDADTGVEKPSD